MNDKQRDFMENLNSGADVKEVPGGENSAVFRCGKIKMVWKVMRNL